MDLVSYCSLLETCLFLVHCTNSTPWKFVSVLIIEINPVYIIWVISWFLFNCRTRKTHIRWINLIAKNRLRYTKISMWYRLKIKPVCGLIFLSTKENFLWHVVSIVIHACESSLCYFSAVVHVFEKWRQDHTN